VDSALAKYARAQKHLAELRAAVDDAHAADLSDELSYKATYPHGDDDPRAVVTLRLELRSPTEWSLIIGDILTNLRAALDHAVYGHATGRQTLNAKQRKDLYHPMLTVRKEWDGTPATTAPDGTITEAMLGVGDKLRDLVAPDVLRVIEKNQPFNADGDPFWHGLAVLGGLVNRDKHRAVLDLPVNIAELAMGDSNLEVISEGALKSLPDGSVEKEITFRRAPRPTDAAPGYTLGLISASAAFLEQIEIPNTGGERRYCVSIMEKLVDATATYLNELEAAGC
jgi:hypothetical protein